MDCLNNIIGVLKDDQDCITTGIDAEVLASLKVTKSGLYLEDLEGGVHLRAVKYADATNNLATMALQAIKNAQQTLESDLIVALANKYVKGNKKFVGAIGRMSYAGSLSVSKNWQGLRLRPHEASDAVIRLSKINFIGNKTQTFDLKLYRVAVDNVMGEVIKTWSVAATANQFLTIVEADPIKLPLMVNGEAVEYWFLYDRNQNLDPFAPKDLKIECSTCERSSRDILSSYFSIQGVQLDNPEALNYKLTDSYSHGLSLDISVSCESEQLFCREYDAEEAIAVAMAHAVRYKAGELLIEKVRQLPDVNRYTLLDREYLWGKRNHFKAQYELRITYLAQSIDVSSSNCYVCREQANQPFYSGIIS